MMSNQKNNRTIQRRGMSLLVCLFVIGITSILLVGILQTAMVQMSAVRNTADYDRALYLAGAAVHQALAEIEADQSWLGTISSTELPAGSGNTYSATTSSGTGSTVVITGVGNTATVTRNLQVTILPGG